MRNLFSALVWITGATAAGLLALAGSGAVIAGTPAATREAARLQNDVADQMAQLEALMADLAGRLAASDQRNAGKLLKARKAAIEKEIRGKMRECAGLITKQLYREAQSKQGEVLGQLEELLGILLAEEALDERTRRMEELRRAGEDIQQLLEDQKKLNNDTRRTLEDRGLKPAERSPDGKDPEGKDGKPEGKDSKGSDDGKDSKSDGKDSKGSDDGKDSKGSKDGKDSKDSDGKDSKGSKDGKDSDGKDSKGSKDGKDSKSSDGKDSKSSDGKDAKDAKSPDGKDSKGSKDGKDSKSSDGKDSKGSKDGKDGKDSKSSDGKDSKGSKDGKDSKSDGKDSKGSKDGKDSKSSDGKDSKGSKDGKDSKDSKGSKDGKDSKSDGKDSKDSKGSKDGKDSKDSKNQSGKPKSADQLREEQEKLREQTGRLIKRLEKLTNPEEEREEPESKDGKDNKGGGDKGGRDQQPKPRQQPNGRQKEAKKAVEGAQDHQQQAERDLGKDKPEEAEPEQEKAVEKLEEAKKQLEEELKQLRKEQQLEVLMRLEAELRRMLAVQQAVTKETEKVHGLRAVDGKLSREAAGQVRAAADRQKALAEDALKLLDVFSEDASAVVFPQMMRHLHGEMQSIARRLNGEPDDELSDAPPRGEPDTGEDVQRRQHGVELRLTELIEAMKRAQKQKKQEQPNKPPPSGGGGQQGPPPLVPPLAELKMLRTLLKAVNEDTLRLEARRPNVPADQAARIDAELKRLSARQGELSKLVEDLEKLLRAGNQ
jgi:hypothetical protein